MSLLLKWFLGGSTAVTTAALSITGTAKSGQHAQEIEKLQNENEKLREQLENYQQQLKANSDNSGEIKKLTEAVDQISKQVVDLSNEFSGRLEEKVTEMMLGGY